MIVGGVELQFGDFLFHSRGDQMHQRTTAACQWGSISLPPSLLSTIGSTIAGHDLAPPTVSQILRPPRGDRQRLLRLHSQAGRIAETDPNRIHSKEVIRSLEQDLILALVTCLATAEVSKDRPAKYPESDIFVQLEATLAAHHDRQLSVQDICNAIGISAQSLRTACAKGLGMSAGHYQRLKRLKRAYTELTQAKPPIVDIAETLKGHGFASLQQFVTEYWNAYGEMPPIPTRISANQQD